MAQSGLLFFNDRDVLADFSFIITGLTGWPGMIGSAAREVPMLSGPEMQGAILDPRLIRRTPGKATVKGEISTTSPALAVAALDALRGLLMSGGEVSVRTGYATDRYCLAVCESFDAESYVGQDLNGVLTVSLSFVVRNGVAWRNAPDGIAFGTTRVACPIGTAESRPVILVYGTDIIASTNPVVTIRNAAGDVVQTMSFTMSVSNAQALRIDSARSTVSVVTTGVSVDALAAGYWTGGDFPVLRPADGNAELGAYPTIEVSAGVTPPAGLITYSRRYA